MMIFFNKNYFQFLLTFFLLITFTTLAENKPLVMYAGAGLRRAVDELVKEFKEETGIIVEVDYAGSGIIIARAREDTRADLFMPGDVWYVDRLNSLSGLIESQTMVSWFVPVIIVQKNNPKKIKGLKDFFNKGVKVGLGNEKASQVGRLSTKILKKSGLDRTKLDPKESLTVNELGVWVKMKNIDAAIVWDAIAANISDSVEIIDIPKKQNIISKVAIALMKTSSNKKAARRFINFLTSKKGKEILRKKGYRTETP